MYKRDTFHPADVLLSQQDPREEKQEPVREPEETREQEGRGRAVGGAAGKPTCRRARAELCGREPALTRPCPCRGSFVCKVRKMQSHPAHGAVLKVKHHMKP